MMEMRAAFILNTVALAQILFLSISSSADNFGVIENKMTYQDVIKARGAPLSKDSMETKRVDVWTYDRERVTFQQGRVVKVENLVKPKSSQLTFDSTKKRSSVSQTKRKKDADEADKILKDIFQVK